LTARPVASIDQLLRASSDDEATLQFPLPDSSFGFHAQQAVEKLYKVLLAFHNGQYPFSHDLKSLRKRVEAAGITLPPCSFRLEELSEYAGNARYDAPIAIPEETRLLLRSCLADLRAFVLSQVQ
jgi:hypothetical protein